ncbi:MAG: GIY-YIG nuclease family protein [Candidatus Kapaibacterium sp.]
MQHNYYVYIMASQRNGTLYIGVTNDIERRVAEHKQGIIEGFTKEHHVDRLVHFEYFPHIDDAIRREKQLKKWNRAWKLELIEKRNPEWIDLSTVNYQFPYQETKPAITAEKRKIGF